MEIDEEVGRFFGDEGAGIGYANKSGQTSPKNLKTPRKVGKRKGAGGEKGLSQVASRARLPDTPDAKKIGNLAQDSVFDAPARLESPANMLKIPKGSDFKSSFLKEQKSNSELVVGKKSTRSRRMAKSRKVLGKSKNAVQISGVSYRQEDSYDDRSEVSDRSFMKSENDPSQSYQQKPGMANMTSVQDLNFAVPNLEN